MHALEIDQKSLDYAKENVLSNHLESRITLHQNDPDKLIPFDESVDFVMCNPPFYPSPPQSTKSKEPNSICTGSETEMITPGGEGEFVRRMINESQQNHIQWYTTMFGKLESLYATVEELKTLNCTNWAVGVIHPGGVTKRWVLGWSWMDRRPDNSVARCLGIEKIALPFWTETSIPCRGDAKSISTTVCRIMTNLTQDGFAWNWSEEYRRGDAIVHQQVWTRRFRRAQKVLSKREASIFTLSIHDETVHLKWKKGSNSIMWESFLGMMRRRLKEQG